MKHFKRNTDEVFNSCAEALQDKVHSYIICMYVSNAIFLNNAFSGVCANGNPDVNSIGNIM